MSTIQLNPTQHAVLTHALDCNNGKIIWFPEHIKGGARLKVLAGLFNRALITSDGVDYFVAAEGYDALGCARPTACSIGPDPQLDAAVAQAEASWTPDVQTHASAPTAQAESDEVDIDDALKVCETHNATGCDEPLAGTDAPANEIDASQGQSLPSTAACDSPADASQAAFERAVECAKEGAAIRVAHEQVIAKVLKRDSKQATIIQMLNHPQGATIAQICEATGWQAHTVRGTFAGAFKKKLGLTITSSKAQGGVRTYHATI